MEIQLEAVIVSGWRQYPTKLHDGHWGFDGVTAMVYFEVYLTVDNVEVVNRMGVTLQADIHTIGKLSVGGMWQELALLLKNNMQNWLQAVDL